MGYERDVDRIVQLGNEVRNQVIRELIEKAEDDGRTFQLSKPISECLDRRQRAQGAADWLKSQMEGEWW